METLHGTSPRRHPPILQAMPPDPWVGGRCPRPGIGALLHGSARGPPSPRPTVRSRRNSSGAFDTPEEMRRSCEPFFSSSYWFRVPARCWRTRLSRRSLRFQRFRRFPQPRRPTTALAPTIHTSVRAISSRRRSPFAAAASGSARISRRAILAWVARTYAIAMRVMPASASDLSRSRSNQAPRGRASRPPTSREIAMHRPWMLVAFLSLCLVGAPHTVRADQSPESQAVHLTPTVANIELENQEFAERGRSTVRADQTPTGRRPTHVCETSRSIRRDLSPWPPRGTLV